MGTSLKVSTPPAMTVDAFPARIFSTALVMATLDEMHAWCDFLEYKGSYIIKKLACQHRRNIAHIQGQEERSQSHHSHSMSTNARRETCIDCRLSCDIARPHFLNDIPRQDVIHVLFIQCRLRNETLIRQPLQIDGHLILVDGRCHGEW